MLPANREQLDGLMGGGVVRNLDDVHAAVWSSAADPGLLELCRLRAAAMLGAADALAWRSPVALDAGLDEAKVAALDDWAAASCFDARERAYLDFTEQFVTSVSHVSDAQIAALCAHDSERDVATFISALYALEFTARLALVSTAVLRPGEVVA